MLIIISAILLNEKKYECLCDDIINEEILNEDKEGLEKNVSEISTMDNSLNNNVGNLNKNTSNKSEFQKQLELFLGFLKLDIIYKPVIFIFLYMLAPSYGDPLFYFYTNELKFTPQVMGRLKLIYGFASVSGIWIFNRYLRNVGFKKIMWTTTILSMIFNMLTIILVKRLNVELGIPDFIFCMAADALTIALAEINTMPLLVLACNICPKNIEGTLYAFLMSVLNLGYLFSNQIGSHLTNYLKITAYNFENLPVLIFIANIVYLLPMPGLFLVNETQYVIAEIKKDNKDLNDEETKKLMETNIPIENICTNEKTSNVVNLTVKNLDINKQENLSQSNNLLIHDAPEDEIRKKENLEFFVDTLEEIIIHNKH